MVSDDFSFPTITDPIPCFVGSPPLWNVSYEVFSGSSYGNRGDRSDEELQRRKSFPMAERDMKLEDEERMDMLWENFNDELLPSLDKNKEERRFQKGGKLDSGLAGDKAELYCVKTWKMSKPSNSTTAMLSPKKPSLLTLMKVMKKLFLLHNSHCHQKKSIS
ncbi:uncharacterized protein LOC122661582 [Telopea speciosissima]|uniref:uncharacterized protein LOC122661582 n=1 Tax=Telopea speciosissima TaxID=54955 RepID=UPI001CC6A66D|nr:uncharacterized protein LOC122661582 [Telopea speciosissima]